MYLYFIVNLHLISAERVGGGGGESKIKLFPAAVCPLEVLHQYAGIFPIIGFPQILLQNLTHVYVVTLAWKIY